MFKERLITSLILISVSTAVLFLLPYYIFIITIIIISSLAFLEWTELSGISSIDTRLILTFSYSTFLVITTILLKLELILSKFRYLLWIPIFWWVVISFFVLNYPKWTFLWRNSKTTTVLFGCITIFYFFFSSLILRINHYKCGNTASVWLIFYIFGLVCSMDSGSFLFGYILGKRKLVPKISPNKTWEGLFGGIITSLIFSFLFKIYIPINIEHIPYFMSSLISIFGSVIGDLTESTFKREAGIKDSGFLVPFHGGILDRIDSLTSSVPIFSFFIFTIFDAV